MADYTAGSVTAKIILDTSEFKKAMESLKKDVAALKGEFNSIKGINEFTKEIDELKKKVKSLSDANKDYREQLKQLREESQNAAKNSKKLKDEIKNETKTLNENAAAIEKVSKATQLFRKDFDFFRGNTFNGQNIIDTFSNIKKATDETRAGFKGVETEAGKALAKTKELKNAMGEPTNQFGGKKPKDGMKPELFFNTDWEKLGFEIGKKGLQDFLKIFANAKIQVKRDAEEIENAIRKFAQFDFKGNAGTKFDNFGRSLNKVAENAKKANEALNNLGKSNNASQFSEFVGVADKVQTALKNISPHAREAKQTFEQLKSSITGFAPISEKAFTGATEGAEKFKQRLAEIAAQTKKTFETLQVELAKANAAQYKYWQQSRGSVSGFAEPLKIKGYNDYLKAASAVDKYNKSVERSIQLEKQRRSALAAKDEIAYSAKNFEAASAGINLFNNKMADYEKNVSKSASATKKFGEDVRNSGKGITSFNNGIVQTAHSGRILSNTLYQIRGALLSVKMIATAMGGMALWGFAMEIAEGVKTTFTAKNEMEAQLKQNAKVGASGLREFNKELDNTAKTFQKINKYQLGETVSSLGVEFNLGMRQMKKAMPIVAMIQSEYIRAGRTSEEAALAVKDILQGEFQRLSRETGVGKDELTKYGWSGDKTDIDSLLDAVKKAGEDRHWDVFAKKATSLNDVLEITKNRFQEFGADFLQTISPMVVSAFNTIIGTIDKLHKAFEGMGSFGKNTLLGGGFIAGITTIGTLLPMITKGMGLSEIATIGWGKSLATAALNLNKAEVAQQGFRKALAAVISGTKAAELADTRWTKAIMGRLLGVKQSVLAQHGYATALVHSRGILMNHTGATNIAKISSMSFAQKIAYLTTNMKLQEAQSLKTSTAIRKIATSTRVLGFALKGLLAIGVVAWFASVASWADTVRARMDLFNDYIDNGKQKVKDAQKTVNDYNKALSKMDSNDPNYYQTNLNKQTAEHNLKSTEAANKLAKQIKKDSEETAKNYDMMYTRGLNNIYDENGYKAVEKYGEDYLQIKYAAYDIARAEEEREKFQYASLQHINEHTKQMEKANVSEDQRLKYITEYSVKAKQAAENLKKFNEGDLTAGVYYLINRLQLLWIDLWNDKDFLNFWESVKKTFEDIKPTLIWIKESLEGIGRTLMKYFSTEQGRWVGGALAVGAVIAGIGYKIAPTLKKLKDFGSTLKDVLGKIKDWKKETGSDKSPTDDTTSTGGINGDIEGKGSGSLGTDLKNIGKNRLKSFVNNALIIAEGMVLMTEAIYMLQAPMWALAETGKTFKAKEKSIQAGIEGLQLIAPTVIAILIPIMALVKVMDMWGDKIMTWSNIKNTVLGIALGIGLVAEAIFMLNLPLLAIASLGAFANALGENVKRGTETMKVVADSLQYLAPFIPPLLLGIGLVAAAFAVPEFGLLAAGAVALGIPVGMALVAETVLSLSIPLLSIAALGAAFSDLDGVKKGAEVIKTTAEAMKYVSEAFGYLVTVQWDLLKSNIAKLLGVDLGTTLEELVKDDGFLPKLSTFAEKFNNMEFKSIDPDKATALKTTAEGLTAVNDALKSATDAINNLPPEFKNGGNGQPLLSYDMENATTGVTAASTGEEPSNYFDQLKKPLEELGKFITWFNTELQFPSEGVDTDKIATISQSADMVTQINDAVNKVKQAMGNIAMGNVATNFAQMTSGSEMPAFGGIGAIGSLIGFATSGGQGDYQSSIGGQLYEMELVLKDLSTFNNNVSGLGGASGGGGGGAMQEGTSGVAQGLTDMVTAVSQAISTLESTLAQAVPNIKQNANNIGTGIRDGIKTGIGDLTTLTVPPLVTALNAAKATGHTYGTGVGYQTTQGYKTGLTIKSATETEIGNTLSYLDGKKDAFYDKGKALGDALSRGYKDGQDMHSPGIIARSTFQELGYVATYFDDAMGYIPEKAYALAELMSANFQPSLAMGGLSVDDLSAFESGLNTITYMANDTDMQTSMAFTNMDMTTTTTMGNMATTVNGAFTNIDQNATTSYGRIVNTTRTSLKNMQDQTTKNITAIKTSWRGMQTALIASAEQIRSETSAKITQLEHNMGSFWNKVNNPSLLLGGGSVAGRSAIRRSRGNTLIMPGTGTRARLGAGGVKHTIQRRRAAGGRDANMYSLNVKGDVEEYLKCLMNGGSCIAGGSGWHFDWTDEIRQALLKWNTHFGDSPVPYDSHLTVGKFENDDFPVRGIAEIAKQYIFNAISQTTYDKYFDSKYGSPLAAWNAGSFNCVDGALVAIAFANAFGFPGGYVAYSSWNGIGHGFAVIPGLGIIDATAIQNRGSFTAPDAVSYPAAGSHTIPQSRPLSNAPNMGTTINIGDINVRIEGDVENAKEKGKQIGEEINNKIYNMLRRSLGTGQ